MGIRYDILLMPMEVEAFYKAMLDDYGIDETKYLLEDNKEWEEHSNYFNKLWKKEEGFTWEGLEALRKKHDTPEMKEYKERTKSNIQIYFTKCPVRKDWTLCTVDNVPFFMKEHNIIYGYYLYKFLRIMEFVINISFHSVSDGGHIYKYYKGKNGKTKTKVYNDKRFGEHEFENFLKSLKNITPYPMVDFHFWMKETQSVRWNWTHHVRFNAKEDVKHIKKELKELIT